MIPIYFPMTFLPPGLIRGLSACFGQTAVLQPSSRHVPPSVEAGANSGSLSIRIPVADEEEKLDSILRAYRDWAQLHDGGEKAFFKAGAADIPFYDEWSVHRIRADIRGAGNAKRSESNPDPVFSARIFLCMAREFDRHQWELESDISSFETMEKDLLHHLRGGEDDEDESFGLDSRLSSVVPDPGAYMTRDRLTAWARLALSDASLSGFFVTSSRAVIEQMKETFPEMEERVRIESIPLLPDESAASETFRKELRTCLDAWAANPDDPKPPSVPASNGHREEAVSLRIHRIGISSRSMLSRLAEVDAVASGSGIEAGKHADAVLVGLVEVG